MMSSCLSMDAPSESGRRPCGRSRPTFGRARVDGQGPLVHVCRDRMNIRRPPRNAWLTRLSVTQKATTPDGPYPVPKARSTAATSPHDLTSSAPQRFDNWLASHGYVTLVSHPVAAATGPSMESHRRSAGRPAPQFGPGEDRWRLDQECVRLPSRRGISEESNHIASARVDVNCRDQDWTSDRSSGVEVR